MRRALLKLTRYAAMMIVMLGVAAGAGRPSFAQQTPPAPPSTMAPPPAAPVAPPSSTGSAAAPSTGAPATPPAEPPATPASPPATAAPTAEVTSTPAAAAAPTASAESAIAQALSAYQKRDYAAAADALKQAIEANPSSVEAHYYLGYALYKLKRFDESRVAFQKAYELRSDYTPPIAPAKK